MKNMKKYFKHIAIIVALSMLFTSIPASAVSLGRYTTIKLDSGETVTLTKTQLDDIINITQDEAQEIAALFAADMIKAGIVVWDEDTEITSIIPMYDNTDTDTVTAYTINLTEGYIVVSACLDTEMQILEWSDKAAPIYQELDVQENEKVIYLGKYEYYVDKGNGQYLDVNNKEITNADMVDNISPIKDIENIPDSVLLSSQRNNENNSRSGTNDSITDMLAHANEKYIGPFSYNNSLDLWYKNGIDVFDYYTDSYPESRNYKGSCGPVAITNTIIAYRNRFRASAPDVPVSNDSVFLDVAHYGMTNNYYKKWPTYIEGSGDITEPAGTWASSMRAYTLGAYHEYNLLPAVTEYTSGLGSYDSFNQMLSANHLIIIMSRPNEYNKIGHAVVCRGFTRFISDTNGWYLSYIHMADGFDTAMRYAPMGWYTGSHSIVINYH